MAINSQSDSSLYKKLPNDTGIIIHGWTITSKKGTIGSAHDIKDWSERTQLPTLPDMCFGTNEFLMKHESGFSLSFNTLDALAQVDHTKGPDIKVSAAEKWTESSKQQLSRLVAEEKVDFVVRPGKAFDWTFTTEYQGTMSQGIIEPTNEGINVALLQQPDPILFFDDFILFEDEVADNGSARLSVKVRVMPSCVLVLLRYFLRVDAVVFRIYDTRIFHEFHKNYFIREFQLKEGDYQLVVGQFEEGSEKSSVTNPNAIDNLLTKKQVKLEKIIYKA